jgi:hypothetical protein
MSNDPRKPENSPDFERDLETVQSEWDRMERTEPPELLDQSVVNAARRDLEARRKARPLRWLGGFATATVVVLAITFIFDQESVLENPAPGQINGLQLEEAPVPAKSKTTESQLEMLSLPPAEPEPMRREARRRNDDFQSVTAPAVKLESKAASGLEKRERTQESIAELADEATSFEQTAPEAVAEAMPGAPATAKTDEPLMQPEPWIEYLLELKQANRQVELEAGIRAFRQAYPDHALPEGLADEIP